MTIKGYITRANKRENIINNGPDLLFDMMDDLIMEEIATLLKSGLTAGEIQVSTLDKIYKSEQWEKVQRKLGRYKDSVLKQMRAAYYDEIEDLRESYPDSDFRVDQIPAFFSEVEDAINDQTGSLYDIVSGTQNDARALVRVFAARQFTSNINRLIEYYQSYTRSLTRTQVKTEVVTFTGNAYNAMRTRFFEGIKTGPVKKLYKYVGPEDKAMRRSCRKYLNKTKTAEEWKKISNHQNGNFWEQRGGYNCRHHFILDLDAMEKELDKIANSEEN